MKRFIAYTICITILLFACNPKGDRTSEAKIQGKVFKMNKKNKLEPANKKTVYLFSETDSTIIYQKKTGKKGEYKFKYLSPGKYRLIVYCKTKNHKWDSTIVQQVVIGAKQKSIKAGDIIILK